MATSLNNYGTSGYLNAMSYMRHGGQKPIVRIYVEGWGDISFWSEIVLHSSDRYNFQVEIYRDPDGRYHDGKKRLLRDVPLQSLGSNLMIAVDADYDWIIEDYSPWSDMPSKSKEIRNNPHILHTYLYSIENFKCTPEAIKGYITKTTCTTCNLDCIRYIETYSEALSNLFLIHLVSMDKNDCVYPLKDFKTDVNQVRIDLETYEVTSSSQAYIARRLHNLQNYKAQFATEIRNFKMKLQRLGFQKRNYYLLFQGHCVAETMVKNRIEPFIQKERINQLESIRRLSDSTLEQDKTESHRHCDNYCRITGISKDNSIKDIGERLCQLIDDYTEINKVKPWFSKILKDLNTSILTQ